MPEFIFTMKDLQRVTPQGKVLLRDIWLSFYDGAKIGVLGANGAGKSTLLRIMAGLDQEFTGEAVRHPAPVRGFWNGSTALWQPAGVIVTSVLSPKWFDGSGEPFRGR